MASINVGDELVFKLSEEMDTDTISATNIEYRLPTNPAHSYGILTGDDLNWSNGNKRLTVTLGSGETIEGGETVDPSSDVKSAAGLADATTPPGPAIPLTPTPKPVIWEFPHGLALDPTAVFYKHYDGATITLADLSPGDVPAELSVVWYYDEGEMQWKWFTGWPESTLITLEYCHIYSAIVMDACIWEIPQP